MSKGIIGLISPGDMGHACGGAIVKTGYDVITMLDGRSELTHERAARAGMTDGGSLEDIVSAAEIILSIMPPESALSFGRDVAAAIKSTGKKPVFVDCNAISPDTTLAIEAAIKDAGGTMANVGIIGPPPGSELAKNRTTRFYASGPDLEPLAFLQSDGIDLMPMGPEIIKASAIKMCYAALTKGTMTLHTAVLLAGELLGVGPELKDEISSSQKFHWEAMNKRVPFYACDAGRWAGEMDQISETLGSAGVTYNLHKGAADVFRLLDETPLAAETRETLDKSRTLDQALAIYADTVNARKAAE